MAERIPGAELVELSGVGPRAVGRPRPDRRADRGVPAPGLGGSRMGADRDRPCARDGPLHRHRRLDGEGRRARRPRVARAPRAATTGSYARSLRASAAARSTPPATASSPRSTGRRGRSSAHGDRESSASSASKSAPACNGRGEWRTTSVGGIAVHIGARVTALAEPGQVLVSNTVKDLVVGSGMSSTSGNPLPQGRSRRMAAVRRPTLGGSGGMVLVAGTRWRL